MAALPESIKLRSYICLRADLGTVLPNRSIQKLLGSPIPQRTSEKEQHDMSNAISVSETRNNAGSHLRTYPNAKRDKR